jgi:ABC-type uncharacterized transport system, permease component
VGAKHCGIIVNILISVFSVCLSLIVGAIIIATLGSNPIQAYAALLEGSLGSFVAFTITLKKSVPLILCGLAVALAFKCSVFNIGVEGQIMVGALCAALVGYYVHLPAPLHITVVLLSGLIGGMLFAFLPAFLNLTCNVSVVISTIMFNYIGQFLVQYCVMGPFHGSGSSQATNTIQSTAVLPAILPKPYQMNLGVVIMVLAVVLVYILFCRTTIGYEMTAVGLNSNASKFQGINVNLNKFLALLISGAIAGLAGGIEVSGTLKKIVNGFSTGYGFSGIPIALIARNNPFAIIISGLFFGIMRTGSLMMQSKVGVSSEVVGIIQGLVVVFLCLESMIYYHLDNRQTKRGN